MTPRALVAATAAAAAVATAGAAPSAPVRAGGDVVNATVTTTRLTPPLPSDFVGYSIEVMRTPTMLGPSPATLRASYANLMRHLAALTPGGRGPNIRVGGSSADSSAWLPTPEACASALPNTVYCINQTDLDIYAAAVPQWNGTVTVDVNFRWPNATGVAAAVGHVTAAAATLGWGDRLLNVELGNEPDLYSANYSRVRPANYTYADYLAEYAAFTGALGEAGVFAGAPGGRGLQGGTYCCRGDFLAGWPAYLAQFGPTRFASASQHIYPGVNGQAGKDDLAWLLSDNCSVAVGQKIAPWAAAAAALDPPVEFVVGESNSINNGGLPNASDVCGTALWAVDMLAAIAAAGARRVNFHGGPWDYYDAIRYPDTALDAPPEVMPLFYGHWLWSDAIANGSSLLGVDVTGTTNPAVKVWASLSPGSGGAAAPVLKLVLLHKDLTATDPASVTLALPGALVPPGGPPPAASLRRLTCPGPYAHSGLAFGGQTFDGSPDGTPQGAPTSEPVAANADGSYTVTLPPISAAVLTVPVAGSSVA
jgi:hypothetical protein